MKQVKRLIVLGFSLAGLAGVVSGSSQEITDSYDFKLALNYAFGQANIDTLILATSGGVYTTTDTFYMAILKPLTIMAKPGLAERPILTHSDPDSNVLEMFRIFDDFTVEGVIFDGSHAQSHGMKYALRFGHEVEDASGQPVFAKDGADITIKNCEFRNIYQDKVVPSESAASGPGHALYFLRPDDALPTPRPVVRAGTVRIENCTFKNIGDEAIRMAETEKYTDPATGNNIERVVDSLIVRNCTFKNIDAECIRFYADLDETTEDAYLLMEHLTIDSSALRTVYIKNNQNAILRNVLISNSRSCDIDRLDRNSYLIQLQQVGSLVSYIDTFNIDLSYALPYDNRIGCTKGGELDEETIFGFDPQYADPVNFDYTLSAASHAFWSGHDGATMGDLRWATNTPTTLAFYLTIVGPGSVTLDPPIEGRCYDSGTSVTLTAVPDSAMAFSGWGGDLSGTNATETVTINAATTITASFGDPLAIEGTGGLPTSYRLAQNFPNPFNPVTRIAFDLPQSGWTTLSIYNLLGQQVAVVIDRPYEAGWHVLDFDASRFSSGVYFYQLRTNDFVSIKKMVYLK